MPVQIKSLGGIMDLDSSEETISPVAHRIANNGRFYGAPGNMRFEGVLGNTLIPNTFLPAGINETIGAMYDALKRRCFFFNWNSNNTHGIYIYSTTTTNIIPLVVSGTNTNGDILNFTVNGTIHNINVLYGDATQGDILYFTNSQKQPCKINIDRALANGYGTIERQYIDVAKQTLSLPPFLVYEDDSTITVNNMRKRLFKFKARYVFDDKEKSVTSSHGELPLPVDYLDVAIDKDPTKNARIAIVVQTGPPNVKKIELLAAQNISGNVFGDFFLIKVLDKAAQSIPDNDIVAYRFYNDQAYTTINVEESIQPYDYVPLEANAQELLNGNVPVYGAIKEGYNLFTANTTATPATEQEQTTQLPFIFPVTQLGESGFQSGQIHAMVIGDIATNDTFNIFTTNETITYVALAGNSAADVITGLATAAAALGFTVVNVNTENLYIQKTGESLLRTFLAPALRNVTDSFAYDWNSRYSFGVVYFDPKGRTNQVITPVATVQTLGYSELVGIPTIPRILFQINHRPPDWAAYYQIVRTKNLTKSKFLYWVTDRTYKDSEFVYIGIENLNTFIAANPSSSFLAYDFSPNDRIRFIKILSDGSDTIYSNNDFEILAQLENPEINGVVQEGQFLKFALPSTSLTFDFGTPTYFNYFIQLYTPALSVSNGLDVYYEFGERWGIGNAGTANAFHQGQFQNQAPDLSAPAQFEFTKGDVYYRHRNINTGVEINYQMVNGERGEGRITLGMNFVDETFADPNVTPGSSPLLALDSFDITTNMDRYILRIGSGAFTFRIKGTINVSFTSPDIYSFYLLDNTQTNQVFLADYQLVPAGSNTFTFDKTFQLFSGNRMFIFGFSQNDTHDSKTFSETKVAITRINNYNLGIMDQSFSDYFEAKVNSNGRPWVHDANAGQVYYPTMTRWGLSFQTSTDINQTNRFYIQNFDEIDRQKGDIMRFKVRDRIMRIFQKRACAQVGIYTKFIQDSGGTQTLTTTDSIITSNNVSYYAGEVGIGEYFTNLISTQKQDYFINHYTGDIYRLSGDGLINLSQLYYGKFYIKNLIIPYNKTWITTNNKVGKLMGAFNYFDQEAIFVLQGGAIGDNFISPYCFSFNEGRNAFSSFFDFQPDWIVSIEDKIASFKDGNLYLHDDNQMYANFYGTQYYPSITFIWNDKVAVKKTFNAIAYQSNQIWVSDTTGEIKTSMINPQTGLQQESQLKSVDYEIQENIRYAALLRDAKSGLNEAVALLEGDYLIGEFLSSKLTYKGDGFSFLYAPYLSWQPSNRNF